VRRVSGLLELAFPLAVKAYVDRLLPSQNWGPHLGAAAGLLAIYFLNTGLQYVVNYWGHVLGISIETEMRRKIFDHLQKLSFRFYDNQKTGHLVGRVTKDLEDVGEVAHHGPEDAFIAVMTFLGSFLLMFTLNPQLALITGLVVPPMTWISTRYGREMTRTMRALFSRVGDFNARIEENVGGIRVVQAFANEDHERALFARDNGRYRDTKLDAYRLMSKSMSLSYMTMRIVQLFVMIAGAYFVLRGDLTVGGFMGFLLLVNVFFRPVEKINAVLETYPKGIAGFKRYTELLDTEPDIADAARGRRGRAPARRHPVRERDVRLRRAQNGAEEHQPGDPRGRNRRLRRPERGRQDDALLLAAALLRSGRGPDHH
jgi:ATP-binding cassette subfamily B protein